MDCQRVSELLEQYFDGELSSEIAAELEAALDGCEHCQEELALLTQMRSAIREPVLKELQEVSFEGMWERIQDEVGKSPVEQVTTEPVREKPVGWLEALKELFAARPLIPVGMGALAAAALVVLLLPPVADQSPVQAPTGVDGGSGPVANNVPPKTPINNVAFVSGVQYETGTVFIDQDPNDPEAPLIVWHIEDDSSSGPEGG